MAIRISAAVIVRAPVQPPLSVAAVTMKAHAAPVAAVGTCGVGLVHAGYSLVVTTEGLSALVNSELTAVGLRVLDPDGDGLIHVAVDDVEFAGDDDGE
jgi:hypothetical protein